MTENQKYKAFISYSHADIKWAKWLQRTLEAYRTPRRLQGAETPHGTVPVGLQPIFRDREELASSHDLSSSILAALQGSESLIVICSPNAARSKWTTREVEEFKKLGRSGRIFCLIVDGNPDAAGTDDDCFPPAIRIPFDARGQQLPGVAEPMAADIREHADGVKLARLKIIAGLLDVELDDLRRRESQRRNRRMAVITGGSLLASAFTAALAINALLARDAAELAQREADQRRVQAEGLLEFMVGDLRDSLEPIGRLDLLESVGQQAMTYFATVDVNKLADGELLRQAQVMTQLGEIRLNQLQYDEALAAFTEAYQRSAALYSKDELDEDRLFNRSQAEFWVGYVALQTGNLDTARHWMTLYRDSTLALVALDPSREAWKRELVYGHHNLAALEAKAGNHDAAETGFLRAVAMQDELISNSNNPELLANRADEISWLGSVSLEQGKINEAISYFASSTSSLRHMVAQDSNHADNLTALAWSLLRGAEVHIVIGDLESALKLIAEADVLFESLVRLDSGNISWRSSLIEPKIMQAHIYAAGEKWQAVESLVQPSISQLEELLVEGLEDHQVHFALARAYGLQAWMLQLADNTGAALQATDRGIAHLRSTEKSTQLDNRRLGELASLLIRQGQLYVTIGREELAADSWQGAIHALESRVKSSKSPYLLDPWARVLILTGQAAEAEAIRAVLSAYRYQPMEAWPQ